jgi:Apolipoprotein A1/A4/E domain
MAKAKKQADVSEAALSALEDALSTPKVAAEPVAKKVKASASVSRPKMPRISDPMPKGSANVAEASSGASAALEAEMAKLIEDQKLEAPAAANTSEPVLRNSSAEARIPDDLVAPSTAANDDKITFTPVTPVLEQPSRMPLVMALLGSAIWLLLAFSYVSGTSWPSIESTGGFLAYSNLPALAGIALAAFLPVIFMFAVASLLRRAGEMRIAARAMTEAAARLTRPETNASESVFTLGQAIRREVASMGDGIDRAVARASELESLVHAEVAQLERSYTDNELKIRMLLDELSLQREAISNNASTMRTAIMGAHDNLAVDLQTVAQKITETVQQAGSQVTFALDGKREEIANSLTVATQAFVGQIDQRSATLLSELNHAGSNMSEKISATSQEVARTIHQSGDVIATRIATTGDDVTQSLRLAGSEIHDRIATTGELITSNVRDHGVTIAQNIAETGATVTESIRISTETIASNISLAATENVERVQTSLKNVGDTIVMDLGLRGGEVTQRFEETGARIAETITNRGDMLATRITDAGDHIEHTITSRGETFASRITEAGAQIEQTITSRGDALAERIIGAGTKVEQTITSRGETFASRITEAGAQIEETITHRGGALETRIIEAGNQIEQTISNRGDALASRLVETSDRINESITVHGKSLEESIATSGQQSAELIAEQVRHAKGAFEATGALVATLIAAETTRAESSLKSFAEDAESRLTSHGEQVRARMAETGKDIVLAIATQGNRVNEALAENARGLSGTLETHSTRVTEKLHAFDDTVGTRLQNVESLLTTHGDSLVERLDSYSSRLSGDFTTRMASFEESAGHRVTSLTSSFDELISRVDAGLDRRGQQLNEQLSRQAIDIAKIMSEGGREVTTAMEAKAAEIDQMFNSRTDRLATDLGQKASAIASTLDDRIGAFEERVVGRLDSVSQTIDQRGVNLAATLMQRTDALNAVFGEQGEGLVSRIEAATEELRMAIDTGANGSIDQLTSAHRRLTGEITDVLGRLTNANKVLNSIVGNAQDSLEKVEIGLTQRVKDIEATMSGIVSDTAKVSLRAENQINLLKDLSSTVLAEAATISTSMKSNTEAVGLVSQDLVGAQERLETALVAKQQEVVQLIKALDARAGDIDATMARFTTTMTESLEQVERRAVKIAKSLSGNSEAAALALREQYDTVQAAAEQERERTIETLRAAQEQLVGELGSAFSRTTGQFRETADQLRGITVDITRELEATRAEVSRNAASLPREVSSQTGAIKRAVGDQLKALGELGTIAQKSSFDVAPARTVPVAARPAPAARKEAPAPRTSWVSNLLNRASGDEAPKRTARPTTSVDQSLDSLDEISTNIARLLDDEALADAWQSYSEGERNVFSRRLYTLQGQQTFDDVRRRYKREVEFREAIDRYIGEFERLLNDVANDGPRARSYLLSDTGKVYTLLAHAADRFE